jgi:hypothetical protein
MQSWAEYISIENHSEHNHRKAQLAYCFHFGDPNDMRRGPRTGRRVMRRNRKFQPSWTKSAQLFCNDVFYFGIQGPADPPVPRFRIMPMARLWID